MGAEDWAARFPRELARQATGEYYAAQTSLRKAVRLYEGNSREYQWRALAWRDEERPWADKVWRERQEAERLAAERLAAERLAAESSSLKRPREAAADSPARFSRARLDDDEPAALGRDDGPATGTPQRRPEAEPSAPERLARRLFDEPPE